MNTWTKLSVVVGGVLLAGAPAVSAQGALTGFGRFEQIAGNPAGGYKQLYEWNLFLSPAGGGTWDGESRRLGAPPGQAPRGDGFYRIDDVPAGTYSVYVSQPDFFASPKVLDGVVVGSGTVNLNVELDVDYSTYFAQPNEWTPWEPDAYQTFVATGSAVTGIAWRHAGSYDDADAEVSLLEDNGNPDVRLWEVVASKTETGIAGDTDEWVRFRAGEAPMVPGRRYAVRVSVDDGMALYKRDKDGLSYADGNAFDGAGNAQNWDLNITVFVERGGTAVTHTRTTSGPGVFDGGLTEARWGQTFVATGSSLAAVDLFAAANPTGFPVTWRVFDGVGGAPVGQAKTVGSAFFASTTALAGASFSRGEVPLVPGRTYYVEAGYAPGLTPYTMEPGNAFADGAAVRDGVLQPALDLSMTILEYTDPEVVFEFSAGTAVPTGTLDASIRHLSGELSPGGGRVAERLDVTGGYSAAFGAELRFDFMAEHLGRHDVLAFGGPVDLTGVTVDLVNALGFVAEAGEAFVILSAPSVTGEFAETQRSNAGDGLAFDIEITETEVRAVVVAGDKPTIERFTASPTVVEPGGFVSLDWSVTGADDVVVSPDVGVVADADTIDVFPEETADLVLVGTGARWWVSDSRVPVDPRWIEVSFDDSGWPNGPAEIGYGDGDERAVWNFGDDPDNKPITTYFRRTFEVGAAQLAATESLQVFLKRDDGAVVYLNGVEVGRDNLPDPPAVIGPDTPALRGIGGAEEDGFIVIDVADGPAALVDGTNVLAVEIHQSSPTSSDISFDLALVATGTLRQIVVSEAGSLWSYIDDGNDYYTTFPAFTDPAFDDSNWATGLAEMGYGDDDEATLWGFGPNPASKFPVAYARRRFEVPASLASRAVGTGLYLLRDDGAAVFLNGEEALVSNVQGGVLDGATPAAGVARGDGNEFLFGEAVDGALVAGENVVAVSVHQASPGSSDTSFDLEVAAQLPATTNVYEVAATNRFGTSRALVVVDVGDPGPAPVVFRVTEIERLAGDQLRVVWESEAGVSYRVEESADLETWTAAGADVAGQAGTTAATVTLGGGGGEAFVRVVRLP